MRHYIAVIHKDDDSVYGVHFPDVPGCFSAGTTLEEAIGNAAEALRFHAEDSDVMPQPRSLDEVRADPELTQDSAEGCVFAAIPFFIDANRTVRANITIDAGLLDAVDATARSRGMTRSAFLAAAARKELLG